MFHFFAKHVRLAKKFEQYILSDSRFEICGKVTMGLVCFRLKGPNSISQNLLFILNDEGNIHMVSLFCTLTDSVGSYLERSGLISFAQY